MAIKTLHQAMQKQQTEIKKQLYIVFGASVIILRELHGFGLERCHKFLHEADTVLREQSVERISMPDKCKKETGMIVTRKGRPYTDVYLLNTAEWDKAEQGFTEPQKIYNIEECMPWIPQVFESAAMIAMHRCYGWGKRKRLPEFLECIEGVRNECRTADYYQDLLKYNYGTYFDLKRW